MERERELEPEVAEVMKDIGHILAGAIKECGGGGYGFALLVFSFGDFGRMNYISNAERPDMLAALKEFIARAEGRFVDDAQQTES